MERRFGFAYLLYALCLFLGTSASVEGQVKITSPEKTVRQKRSTNPFRVARIGAAEPGLTSVTFTSGNINCKDNVGDPIPPPHWKNNSPLGDIIHPTAVIKGGTMSTELTFELPEAGPGWTGTVSIVSVKYYDFNAPNGYYSLGFTQPSPNTISIPAPGTASVTISVGPFPNMVHPGSTVQIECKLTETTGNLHRDPTVFGYPVVYEVYATPQAPQASPWLGVLDDACSWAYGQNTASMVSKKITTGEFFSQRFYYPGDTATYWTSPSGDFLLSDFLATYGYQPGNCQDVSDYLLICNNAVGVGFQVFRLATNTGALFDSNPVCLIGSDPTYSSTYSSSRWAWHQVAQPAGSSNSVYDVCAAYWRDLGGAIYQNPAMSWNLVGYWQTPGSLVELPGKLGLVDIPICTYTMFYGPTVIGVQ